LSERELGVLRLKAAGLTRAEIGQELFIAPGTVSAHITSVRRKLEVRNVVAAIVVAIREGDIDPDKIEIARRMV
jgi:DNA-binding CsgD family transcriptional regulator